MALKNYNKVVKETPEEINIFVEDSMHILERLHELLDQKFEGKQKLLADKMGKSEAEVSKMLNGVQNFTLLTLSKLKAAFGESIIAICTDHDNATFIQAKVTPNTGYARLSVQSNGGIEEKYFTPSSKPSITTNAGKSDMI